MIVLDTHAWIALASDERRLGREGRRRLAREKTKGISAISVWELAMLVSHQRVRLDRDPLEWVENSIDALGLTLLPITPAIAITAGSLGSAVHGDPADRIIIATALTTGAALVTADARIQQLGVVETIW